MQLTINGSRVFQTKWRYRAKEILGFNHTGYWLLALQWGDRRLLLYRDILNLPKCIHTVYSHRVFTPCIHTVYSHRGWRFIRSLVVEKETVSKCRGHNLTSECTLKQMHMVLAWLSSL